MSRGALRWASTTFTLLLVSGCADGGNDRALDDPSAPLGHFTGDRGAIVGTLLDVEGRPLVNGTAFLVGTSEFASVRADGRFAFNDLAAGTYAVAATAPGFITAQRRVEVVANQAVEISILLEPQPIHEPHLWYKPTEGYWSCVLRLYVQNADCSTVTGEPYDGSFAFPVAANYSTLYFELTWKPSSLYTQPSRASMSFYSYNATTMPGGRPHGVNRSAPVITVTVRPGDAPMQPQWTKYPSDMTEARVYLIPIGYVDPTPDEHGRYGLGVIYQQRYKLYASFFYYQEKSDKYTGIPDG